MERTMTSSLRLKMGSLPRRFDASRPGFTLVEMLVVMGIILLLIAILLPAVNSAYKSAVRNSMAADLQVISQALEAYHGDFGDYPRSGSGTSAVSGAKILCWALIAPGPATSATGIGYDGADGPGFRLRATGQGKVYGPYLPPERFQLGTVVSGNTVTAVPPGTAYDDSMTVLADRYGHVILYFPAALSVSPTKAYVLSNTPIGASPPTCMYNYADNSEYLPSGSPTACALTLKTMQYKMGDVNNAGFVSLPQVPATVAPYILWSAGPDGKFGPPTDPTRNTATGPDDDVTYPVLNDIPVGFSP